MVSNVLICSSCARLYTGAVSRCPYDQAMLLPPSDPRTGTEAGEYRLMGALGNGGAGVVYRAQHSDTGDEAVVKVLHPHVNRHPETETLLVREAQAAAALASHHIIGVQAFGRLPDGCLFLVEELVLTPSLRQVVNQQGALPVYRAVNILRQICQTLALCHEHGLAHRSLKPRNVFLEQRTGRRDLVKLNRARAGQPALSKEGTYDFVRMTDFGSVPLQIIASRIADGDPDSFPLTSAPYIAPEQAQGDPGRLESDIYSLGVMLYELLTGKLPFAGSSAAEILSHHVHTPITSLREARPDLNLPPEADSLVELSMGKEPDLRFQTVTAFSTALGNCFGDEIYGRDIDRFITVRHKRVALKASDMDAYAARAPSDPSTEALAALARRRTTDDITERTPQKGKALPDAAPGEEAIHAELAGLFTKDTDDQG